MTDAQLDALIDAAAPLLDLSIDSAWRPSIRTHLALSLRHAHTVATFDLPDEIDPAPTFRA